VSQSATATADATQTQPLNAVVLAAGTSDPIDQANATTASALATATSTVAQVAATDPLSTGEFSGAQAASVIQQVEAGATASQTDVMNAHDVWSRGATPARIGAVTQSNTAAASVIASADSAVTQLVEQGASAGGSGSGSAAQSSSTTQQSAASASASQTRVANVDDVQAPQNGDFRPAVSQSNTVRTGAVTRNSSTVFQSVVQRGGGEGIVWHATATQDAQTRQSGDASASAGQTDRTNHAGWNGSLLAPASPGASAAAPVTKTESGTLVAFSFEDSFLGRDLLYAGPAATAAGGNLRSHGGSGAGAASAGVQRHGGDGVLAAVHVERSATPSAGGVDATRYAAETAAFAAPATPGLDHVLLPVWAPAGASQATKPLAPLVRLPLPHDGSIFGTGGGAAGAAPAGVFGVSLAPYKFAAPTLGRPQSQTSALGRPAETAPLERPG
jgi:hypothetical protein